MKSILGTPGVPGAALLSVVDKWARNEFWGSYMTPFIEYLRATLILYVAAFDVEERGAVV